MKIDCSQKNESRVICLLFFRPGAIQPIVGVYFTTLYRALASSSTRLLDHIQRRATVGRTRLNEWSVRRRDLYLTTQHSQQTNIHDPGGIRTHDRSRRAAEDLRLRPRGYWDRHLPTLNREIKPQCLVVSRFLQQQRNTFLKNIRHKPCITVSYTFTNPMHCNRIA